MIEMKQTGDPNRSRRRQFTSLFVCFAVIVCLEGCVDGTTTSNKRPFETSNTAGAKRQKTGHKVMEPAFENAGQQAGLEIWRIEDFKPVAYPKNQYGKFYTGDSYIVLNTKISKSGYKSYDLHFWLGSETSQDEAGSAAIFSVQLDDQFNGDPVQHREVQEHESQAFLSYFKNGGVRYAPGGVSSGFSHVDRNAFEKRLFEVKGSRNIRVKQVVPSIASMNNGDCFILDAGRNIYVYVGSKARRVEKLKAINAANQIRDQDHAGKAKVTIVDEYSPESDFTDFFTALGEGSKADVPEESAGGDDQQFETAEENHVTLYRISDRTGKVEVTPVSQKPLDAAALDPTDCFILDTADANLYVWIGKQCDDRERKESMKKADDFLTSKKYPKWAHVQRIVQGAEPTAFTQYFRSWQAVGERHPRLLRSVSNKVRLYHCEIRDKRQKWEVEEIKEFEQEDLDNDDVMVLDAQDEVFVWLGKGASEEERERGPKFAEKLLHLHGRTDIPVHTINQGEEPESFKEFFPSWEANYWDDLPDIRSYIKNELSDDE